MAPANKFILIVDDDPDILNAMEMALSLEGFQVTAANNVATALKAIAQVAPSIVFLDYYLAGDNPAAFVRRARDLYPQITIVLMTGAPDAGEKAKNVGLAYYLPKPFALDNLLGVFRRCLAREAQRQRRTLRLAPSV